MTYFHSLKVSHVGEWGGVGWVLTHRFFFFFLSNMSSWEWCLLLIPDHGLRLCVCLLFARVSIDKESGRTDPALAGLHRVGGGLCLLEHWTTSRRSKRSVRVAVRGDVSPWAFECTQRAGDIKGQRSGGGWISGRWRRPLQLTARPFRAGAMHMTARVRVPLRVRIWASVRACSSVHSRSKFSGSARCPPAKPFPEVLLLGKEITSRGANGTLW